MTKRGKPTSEDKAKNRKEHREAVRQHIQNAGEHDFDEATNKCLREPDLENKKIVSLGKKTIAASDIVKLVGLLAFFVVAILAVWAAWPYIKEIFEPGGVDKLISQVHEAGAAGVLILFAFQLLQVIVAFIPGEVTAVAAGMMYGPWLGALLILVGGAVASAIVYYIVHFLGAPFVHDMVPKQFISKFREYERTGKFNIIVFILFLIPGLPKDAFTYIVGLSDMKCSTFLVLSTLARTPGVLVTTYAASGITDGDYVQAVIIFAVFAALAVLGLIFRDKIMAFVSSGKEPRK